MLTLGLSNESRGAWILSLGYSICASKGHIFTPSLGKVSLSVNTPTRIMGSEQEEVLKTKECGTDINSKLCTTLVNYPSELNVNMAFINSKSETTL